MRLFIGVEVPQEIKEYIRSSLEPIRTNAKGWENINDYHLTLLFIGATSTEQKEEIIERMKKIKARPFELKLNGLQFFPRRILYQGFSGSDALIKLKDKVENEFSEWVNPSARPFTAHLTVKRFQRYEYEELKKRIADYPYGPKSFRVESLVLFKSEKDSENNKYHVIYRETLAES